MNRRGDAMSARAQGKLTELLTKGKEPLVRRLLAKADADRLQGILEAYATETASFAAMQLLAEWPEEQARFVKIVPVA